MQHMDFLKPRLGMSLLVVDRDIDDALSRLPEKIRPLSAGLEESKLQPVISALA